LDVSVLIGAMAIAPYSDPNILIDELLVLTREDNKIDKRKI